LGDEEDYMPDDVMYFIVGMEMFDFSFDFVPVKEIGGVREVVGFVSFEQENSKLK
jgi:hypothetical protein